MPILTAKYDSLAQKTEITRMKNNIRLFRHASGLTLKEIAEYAEVCVAYIGNAETQNGPFTKRTYSNMLRNMEVFTLKPCDVYNTKYEIPRYIYDVLIRYPDKFSTKMKYECKLYAELLAPAIYMKSRPMDDILKVWHECFTDRYPSCLLIDSSI